MKLIGAISFRWARGISDKFYFDNKIRRLYYYWIKLLFGTFVKVAIVLGISYILDVLMPTIYSIGAYAIFKVVSGGMHRRHVGRTILLAVMLFITMGVIADTFYYIYKPFNDVLTDGSSIYIRVLFELCLWIGILFVPVKINHRVKLWKLRAFLYKVLTIILVRYLFEYTSKILEVDTLEIIISIWTGAAFYLLTTIPVIDYAIIKLNQMLNYK